VTTTLPPAQPLPFRLLLDEAVRQTRHHFKRIYPAVAIPLALLGGLIPLAQGLMFRSFSMEGNARPSPGAMIQGVASFWLVMLVWLTVYFLSYAVLLAAAVDGLTQRSVAMGRTWLFILRPRVLGTLVLAAIVTGLGLMLCVVPGIYLGLQFSFTVPVMADEGLFGTEAMRRSAELARYNPQHALDGDPRFKVFVIVFVGALLGYVISMLVQLPMIVVQQLIIVREVAGGRRVDPAVVMARMTWLQVPSQIFAMLTNTAVHLYVSFGLALLYVDVKRRREGTDLEAAVAQLVRSHLGAAAGLGAASSTESEMPPP
jgi:uncharacterized membrane protein